MDKYDVLAELAGYLASDAGRQLRASLREEGKRINLVQSDEVSGITDIWILTGDGFLKADVSSPMTASFGGLEPEVGISGCTIEDVVEAVIEHGLWDTVDSFIKELNKLDVENDGIPFKMAA